MRTVANHDLFVRIQMMFAWIKLGKCAANGWHDVIEGGDVMSGFIPMKLVRVDRKLTHFEIDFDSCLTTKVLDLQGVVIMTHNLCKQRDISERDLMTGILCKHFI